MFLSFSSSARPSRRGPALAAALGLCLLPGLPLAAEGHGHAGVPAHAGTSDPIGTHGHAGNQGPSGVPEAEFSPDREASLSTPKRSPKSKVKAPAQNGHAQTAHGTAAADPRLLDSLRQEGRKALARLLDGNERFVGNGLAHPNRGPDRRTRLAQGQKPFAILVSCSDSRVPPEIVFDQGLGDLFVVRSAGHLVDDIGLGSIEYAAEHLGVNLILVLGHERCGAVKASCDAPKAPAHINALVKAIQPAVQKARGLPGDLLPNAVKENVIAVTEKLKSSKPILAHLLETGRLRVEGAVYDLDTGLVEMVTGDPAVAETGGARD